MMLSAFMEENELGFLIIQMKNMLELELLLKALPVMKRTET
jgi:hypothetical protein